MTDREKKSDTPQASEKTLSVGASKTLSLKRPVEQGTVRQSFSHGRSKAVVVEKVRTRVITPPKSTPDTSPLAPAPEEVRLSPSPEPESASARAPSPPPKVLPPVLAPEPITRSQELGKISKSEPEKDVSPELSSLPEKEKPLPASSPEQIVAPTLPKREKDLIGKSETQKGIVTPRKSKEEPNTGHVRTKEQKAPTSPSSAPQKSSGGGQKGGVGTRGSARPQKPHTGVVLRSLTEEEREARMRALAGAKEREEMDRKRQEFEARLRSERETAQREEREAAEARRKEEETRRVAAQEAKKKAEEEAKRRFGTAAGENAPRKLGEPKSTKPEPEGQAQRKLSQPPLLPLGRKDPLLLDEEEGEGGRKGAGAKAALGPKVNRNIGGGGGGRTRSRLTVTSATSDEEEERTRSVASFRRRVQRLKGNAQQQPKEKISREVVLPETITIQELANRMSERGVDVIRLLMHQGQMAKITDVIDADTAQLIAEELGHTVKRVAESDIEEGLFDAPDLAEELQARPPVVTIMGHVDHGKTSLLDAIRSADVVSGEAGGITQHIGAYQARAPDGSAITFIDTPGHAAFTAMRARGAKVTDVVILVVAADDGVMPQTVEAIQHAKAAQVPIVVAINKIDKPEARPDRVRAELIQHGVQVESLGGDTLEIEVSAKQRLHLDKLLEALVLQSEILQLRASSVRAAEGTVIEARLDKGRGPVATVLVQRGTLRVGDIVVAGSSWGKVRALLDDHAQNRQEAGPSVPVEVLGFSSAPEAGDRIVAVEHEARAREISEYRERQRREQQAVRGAAGGRPTSLSDMMSQLKTAERKEVPLVIKGDVQGSVEAIIAALEKLNTEEVAVRILYAGVGGITETDVTLAHASSAVVLGFNVRAHKEARELAERVGTELRYYNVIYNLVDDIKAAMSGLLSPTLREEMLGNAGILEIFTITKVGKIAGCRVTDGRVERGAHVRLIRDNVVIHEGKLSTLKRFKDEVKEVLAGQECGMAFESYQDMQVGDVIECYRVEEIKRSL